VIYGVISWDYRQQPNIDELDRIVANATATTTRTMLRILNVDDTNGGQDCAVIVTDEDLTQQQRTEIFERHERGDL
jgi:hypothetical protein